jgi:hypothetical protein
VEGWVKLHRKTSDWQWYQKPYMFHLFFHLVIMANHEDKKWMGISVKRGELITGLHSLKAQTGISIRSIRTCLDRLQEDGEITKKSTSKFSIITICNYDKYQAREEATDKQPTSNRQATDKQPTTNKNLRTKELKKIHGSFQNVFLSEEEHQKLKEKFNGKAEEKIEKLSEYIASHGKKYVSHYATILSWSRKDIPIKTESEWGP